VVGPSPAERWKVVEVILCTKWNFSWLVNTFHLRHWVITGTCWNHFSAWISFVECASGGWIWWITHPSEQSWKVVELFLHQMELPHSLLSMSPWNWLPDGSLCGFLCSGHGSSRLDLVEVAERSGTKWNFSWLVNLSTWVWSHWNHIGACWALCGFLWSVVFGALVVGPTPPWNGLGRWWGRSLVPNGTIPHGWSPFHLGLESLEPCWCLLEHFVWFVCSGVVWGWI
jgi:hypothetical protein